MTERALPYAIYSFSQHTLIKNIFIHELGAGDVGVLCGKPGCGKSTLIYQLGKDFPGRVVVFTATGFSGFCQLTHTACTHGKLQPDWRDVRISRFWSTLMPALSPATQPIIIVIDNADALARHLPAFVDNFRHLAASFDAGASLLLVGAKRSGVTDDLNGVLRCRRASLRRRTMNILILCINSNCVRRMASLCGCVMNLCAKRFGQCRETWRCWGASPGRREK